MASRLMFHVLVGLLVLGGVAAAQESAVIAVTLRDVEGWPVSGVEVTFAYESGRVGGSCVTDGAGYCEIALEGAPAGLIRGHLAVGEAGRRSLIWPGGTVEVPLQLQADGSLYVATESIGGEIVTPGEGDEVSQETPPSQEFPTPVSPEPAATLPAEPTATSAPAATPGETAGSAGETATPMPEPVKPERNPAVGAAVVGVLVVIGLGLTIWGVVQGWRQRE